MGGRNNAETAQEGVRKCVFARSSKQANYKSICLKLSRSIFFKTFVAPGIIAAMKIRASRYTMLFFGTVATVAATSGLLVFSAGGFAASQAQANGPWQIGLPRTPQLVGAQTVETTLTPNTKATRALFEATKQNDVSGAEKAFADGADANATVVYHYPNPSNRKLPHPEPAHSFFTLIDSGSGDPTEPQHKRGVALFRAYLNHGLNLDAKSQDESEQTPLSWAIFATDDALVRDVVTRGANVNAVSRSPSIGGNAVNLLLFSALRGRDDKTLPLLTFLLEKRANPNVYDASGVTPLHQAAFLGLPRCVETLLAHGADPQAKTRAYNIPGMGTPRPAGLTAIQMAATLGNADVMRLLAKATPNLSPVDAVTAGAAPLLKNALDRGTASANSKDSDGTPFLTLAVYSGDVATVRLLLERGAKVDARTTRGRTALFEAAFFDQTEIARLLLAHHADPNAVLPFRNGAPPSEHTPYTPLAAAVMAPSPGVVALLLKHGATVNDTRTGDVLATAVVHAGNTPLRPRRKNPNRVLRGEALLNAQDNVFEQILAKANVPKNGGKSLALAADRGQWGLAHVLIERKADVNAIRPGDGSVLMLTVEAIGMRRHDISPEWLGMQVRSAKEIQELRAEVADDNKEGMAFLRALMQHHPNVNAVIAKSKYDGGNTALEVARFWKMPDVEVLLKKAGARR